MTASASGKNNIGTQTSNTQITAVAAEATVTFTEIDASDVLLGTEGFAIRSTKLQQVAVSRDGTTSAYTYSAVHKYYNGSSYVPYDGEGSLFDVAVFKINVKVPAANAADVAAAAKDVQLSIITSEADTGVTGGDTDRLLGWLSASNQTSVANAGAYAAQTVQSATLTFDSHEKTEQNWTDGFDVGYLAVFFHGEDNNDGTTALTGNVYVKVETVTHTAG